MTPPPVTRSHIDIKDKLERYIGVLFISIFFSHLFGGRTGGGQIKWGEGKVECESDPTIYCLTLHSYQSYLLPHNIKTIRVSKIFFFTTLGSCMPLFYPKLTFGKLMSKVREAWKNNPTPSYFYGTIKEKWITKYIHFRSLKMFHTKKV